MVLAKLGTSEMVGQYSLGLAITAPVIMFANLQLRGIQATDAKRQYVFGSYLALRILTSLLAFVVVAGIVLLSDYRHDTALVILLIALAKVFEAFSDIYYSLFQQHEQMDRIAKSMFIKGPLSLLALGIAIWFTGKVYWGAFALAVSWGGLLVFYDLRNARMLQQETSDALVLHPAWNLRTMTGLAWLALPLGVVMGLLSLNTNIPRYVLEQSWNEAALGIYAAIAYILVGINKVILALGESASPRLAQHYTAGNRQAFQKLMGQLLGIGLAIGLVSVIGSLVAGPFVLAVLYTPEYASYNGVLVMIMIASVFSHMSVFLGYGMTAARFLRIQMPLFVIVTLTTFFTSQLFVPSMGLVGAAVSLIASLAVQFIGSLLVVYQAIRSMPSAQQAQVS